MFMSECLHVSETQWLRPLVKELIETVHFCQVSMDVHKFAFNAVTKNTSFLWNKTLPLTLKVPITAIDALRHFETG